MKETVLNINKTEVLTYSLNTVIVGTGASGYNAALRLYKLGVRDIAIVTEGVNMGTSRNTGSDKQTYYKMNLCADYPDSPKAMAEDLFRGGCVDGDLAYAEAALSVPCFLQLSELGVPFPVNRLGEYVGYKTDHDPRARATSAGPLTSKLMTECLERAVNDAGIKIFDGMVAVSILKNKENKSCGILALNKNEAENENRRFVAFNAKNVIFATGGPAGIYASTVYPFGHSGSSGVAFEAGVKGKNLTEWQYGLASVAPRWNVSGTYMQVLPRFVSVDADGNEYEFLSDYYKNTGACLSMIFRKGYEWPFDSRKALSGSSVIDLLVYRECVILGRRVYLDFRKNPEGFEDLPYELLDKEASDYLGSAEACFGTPLDRLMHMNKPAYDLYYSKGVDLKTEMLEISLCAQHNNGGFSTDMWWQTNVEGLFAAGEAVGSHGIYRPGGSALNAGQVGSMRASQYIAQNRNDEPMAECDFIAAAESEISKHISLAKTVISDTDTVSAYSKELGEEMSAVGAAIRSSGELSAAIEHNRELLTRFDELVKIESPKSLHKMYRLRESLISRIVYLSAMRDYIAEGGKSRGSAIYTSADGIAPDGLEDIFKFQKDGGELNTVIQETEYKNGECTSYFRPVRPLPEGGGFFENVWRTYRENKNVY